MKRFKKILRRLALILFIMIACLVPVPFLFQKKSGKFDQDNKIELVDSQEEKTQIKTKKIDNELFS
ncbi:hypothetical protein GCM10022259_23440 [Aquimarina mytili]